MPAGRHREMAEVSCPTAFRACRIVHIHVNPSVGNGFDPPHPSPPLVWAGCQHKNRAVSLRHRWALLPSRFSLRSCSLRHHSFWEPRRSGQTGRTATTGRWRWPGDVLSGVEVRAGLTACIVPGDALLRRNGMASHVSGRSSGGGSITCNM
jgi:hypothetical protein